jgi:hypothetical protein
MKENHPKHNPVDAGSLWITLQELEAGTILTEDRVALMNLLTHSPEAQNIYLEYFELSAMIADEAKTHSEISCLPCVPEAPANHTSPAGIGRIPKALWMAAAAVLILAITLKLVLPPLLQNQAPSAALTLKAVPGSQWAIDGQPGHTDKLAEGSTLHVTSGTVKLHHESGASLIVQGPATVAFPKLNKPVLENGWLWLDSEHNHDSFEITTPELLIHNIGTRFGVHVPADGPAAIHLLEGQVEAFSRTHDRKLASLKPENRAITINAEGDTSVLALSPDPFPLIDQLLSKPENYETTVLSQSPSGYWRLDDMHKEMLTNRVAGGTAGRLHQRTHNDAPGPQNSQGFPGFGQGNRAVHFSAKDLWAPLSLGSAPFHNSILFKEDFSSGGKLHGSSPTLGDETRWIATKTFDRDGGIDKTSTGTATLAFNPVNGVIYTLDASFGNLSAPAESDDAWVALAFSHGQGVSSMLYGETQNRFLEGQTTGRAWMFFRATDTSLEPFACLGTTGKQGGLADPAPWENWKTGHGGDIDMRIVLDTTGGAGYWKATWYAKRPSESEYTMVRATTDLLNEGINSVGIAVGRPGVSGSVKSFVLKAAAASPKTQQERLAAAPSTMTRSAGAVSMWIRPEGTDKNDQIIWAAGNSPDNDSMHLRITPSGHVRFFMDNDRYDLLVSSEFALTKNTWQHLVTTWSTDTAEIHINGKLVASDGNFMEMPPDELPEFYFGSGPIGSRFSNFVGTIDEIVTYNRFLTAPEIQRQYEAACSSAAE